MVHPSPMVQYQQPNYGQQGQYGQPNYGNPGAPAPYTPYAAKKKRNRSTPLEIGYLYAVGTGYGVGMGIWIDAEANIKDPGLRFVPPLLTGAAAPAGIYLLDSPPMPKGLPSAIATGMLIGAARKDSASRPTSRSRRCPVRSGASAASRVPR